MVELHNKRQSESWVHGAPIGQRGEVICVLFSGTGPPQSTSRSVQSNWSLIAEDGKNPVPAEISTEDGASET